MQYNFSNVHLNHYYNGPGDDDDEIQFNVNGKPFDLVSINSTKQYLLRLVEPKLHFKPHLCHVWLNEYLIMAITNVSTMTNRSMSDGTSSSGYDRCQKGFGAMNDYTVEICLQKSHIINLSKAKKALKRCVVADNYTPLAKCFRSN